MKVARGQMRLPCSADCASVLHVWAAEPPASKWTTGALYSTHFDRYRPVIAAAAETVVVVVGEAVAGRLQEFEMLSEP